MTPSERTVFELEALRHRLYGGELPGETGDIPEMKQDIAYIKGAMGDLAGFYKTLTRMVQFAGAVAALVAGLFTISGLLGR